MTRSEARRQRPAVPLWDRVWSKIEKLPGEHGCWRWTGALSKKRNGRRPVIQLGGRGTRVVSVARLVCEDVHGPAPSTLHEAGHLCPDGERDDCVRPDHLTWMTRVENELHKQTYNTKE